MAKNNLKEHSWMFSLCFFCWVGHKNGFLLVSAGTGWFSNTPTQLIYKKMLHIRRPSPANWYLMPGKTGVDKPIRVSCHVGYWLFCGDVKHRSSPVLKNCHSTHQTSEIKAITIYYFEFYFVIKFRGINSCNQVFVINVRVFHIRGFEWISSPYYLQHFFLI